MGKIRVYELAKELGVDNKAVITLVHDLNIAMKASHSSSLEDSEADQIRRAIIRTALGNPEAKGVKETVQKDSSGNAVTVRRSGNIIRRRKGGTDDAPEAEVQETPIHIEVEIEEAPAHVDRFQAAEDLFSSNGSHAEAAKVEEFIPQEEVSVVTALVEEVALEAVVQVPVSQAKTPTPINVPPRGPGPKILGRIELPQKKVIALKPKEKPVRIGSGPVVAFESGTDKKAGPLSKTEREKRGRRKEFTRGDLVDYDGRLVKRAQKRKGQKGDRNDSYSLDQNSAQESRAMKASKKVVKIDEVITVGELAKGMSLKSGEVIKKLFDLGQMATINQPIDIDTARVIAEEFGFQVESVAFDETDFITAVKDEDPASNLMRAPVVTVMGHVDHGKTSLLDAIRETSVAAKEHGGITQHIGAYKVILPSGKAVTFIDTPGHAAFTSMRARGAKVTDIVILVVAADDGVMPQTIEAISHAKAAKVPIVVAVNKMDKQGASIDRAKQQLAEHSVQSEDWGGEVMFFPVSALKKQGLKELLDGVLLQAEVLELKANPVRKATGTIIESRQDKGRGIVATILVQNGTLRVGDAYVSGAEYGRVKSMIDYNGIHLKEAGPSTPVEITGFSGIPEAGDDMFVVDSDSDAREIAQVRADKKTKKEQLTSAGGPISFEAFSKKVSEKVVPELNIIIKADVHGSFEAVRTAVEKLIYDKVKVAVIHSAVGGITENDVKLAQTSKAVIVGFGVRAEPRATRDAEAAGVEIRYYNVIYELVDDIRNAMVGLLAPVRQEANLGRVEVRNTFVVPKIGTIAGGYVLDGMVKRGAMIRLLRDNKLIHEGKMSSLRRFKDDVKEVQSGYECGLGIEKYSDIKVGDIMEVFEIKEIADTLS